MIAHSFNTQLFIDIVSSNFDYFDYHGTKGEYFREWYQVIENAWQKESSERIGKGIEHGFAYQLTLGNYKKLEIYLSFNLDNIMQSGLNDIRTVSVMSLNRDGFYLADGGMLETPLLVTPLYYGDEPLLVIGGHGHLASTGGDCLISVTFLREKDLVNQRLFGSEFERLVYACLCEVKQIASWRMRELTVSDEAILNKRFNKHGFYTFDCFAIGV